jgi:prophage DNA circulation protein
MAWRDELQQASWRGIPFGVLTADNHNGRRVALHEYFRRAKPWAEDIGRAARRHGILGFLVTNDLVYGGGDVLTQRQRMVKAAETAGSGTLVHPTLGTLTVSLLSPLITRERWDTQRYFELQFDFVEAGAQTFPNSSTNTGKAVQGAALTANSAASDTFNTTLSSI